MPVYDVMYVRRGSRCPTALARDTTTLRWKASLATSRASGFITIRIAPVRRQELTSPTTSRCSTTTGGSTRRSFISVRQAIVLVQREMEFRLMRIRHYTAHTVVPSEETGRGTEATSRPACWWLLARRSRAWANLRLRSAKMSVSRPSNLSLGVT